MAIIGLAGGTYESAGAAASALTNANAYTDSIITGLWKDHGNFDVTASLGDWPTYNNTIDTLPIKSGNLWVVANASVNGTTMIGGVVVNNGDTIRAIVDDASNNAIDWAVNEGNLGYTPENIINKDTDGTLSSNSDSKYPSQKAIKTYADTKQTIDATLTALASYNTNGFLVQTSADTFVGRSIIGTYGQVDVTFGNGMLGNATISLPASGVTAATYGSESSVATQTVDLYGRTTNASSIPIQISESQVTGLTTDLAAKQTNTNLSTDGTFSSPLGTTYPSTLAVKTYVDNRTSSSGVSVYANTTVYTVGNQVTYLGVLYICNIEHTSSTATPDFTKFYPADGILVTAIASGTYTPPINSNIREYLVQASGSFSYDTSGGITKDITVINTNNATKITVSSTPDVLTEAPNFIGLLELEVGERAVIRNLFYSRSGPTIRYSEFKLRSYNAGSPIYVNFNAASIAVNRTVTFPNANVDLGKVPTGISYSPTTGVVTLANTDGANFTTTSIGAIADNILRIQSSSDATRKIGFNCTSIGTGQTRTITMPNANVTLAKVPTGLTYTLSTGVLSMPTSDSSSFNATLGTFTNSIFRIADNIDNTKLLALELSGIATGTTRTITIPNSDVNLGDISNKQNLDATLTALSGLDSTLGFIVQTDVDVFAKRSIVGGSDTTVVNGSGVGNVTVNLLTRTGVNGTFGSSTSIPQITYNSKGIATSVVSVAISTIYSDSVFRIQDNIDNTKLMRFELSGIATGTTRTITMPNSDINLGKLSNSSVAVSVITVGSSPFVYNNTTSFDGDVITSDGTVSNIEFSRDGTTYYSIGQTSGVIRLSPNDYVRVTYTVVPTMIYVPR